MQDLAEIILEFDDEYSTKTSFDENIDVDTKIEKTLREAFKGRDPKTITVGSVRRVLENVNLYDERLNVKCLIQDIFKYQTLDITTSDVDLIVKTIIKPEYWVDDTLESDVEQLRISLKNVSLDDFVD